MPKQTDNSDNSDKPSWNLQLITLPKFAVDLFTWTPEQDTNYLLLQQFGVCVNTKGEVTVLCAEQA